MRSKTTISLEDGQRVMDAALRMAETKNWAVTVAVVDDGGNLLCFSRRDSAKLSSIAGAIEKAKTSAFAGCSTKVLEGIVSARSSMLKLPNLTPIQGGVPLQYKGELVGAIGVSGVASPEDEEVAAAGAEAL